VIILKNYAKLILYAYPLLRTVEKDYEEHIGNKALLSYEGRWTAEQTAEYLAGEILEMRRLEWLKGIVNKTLASLTDVEKTLVAIRYFGKTKGARAIFRDEKNPLKKSGWTERSYFRKQEKLGERLTELFALAGLTEEVFAQEFAEMEIFKRVARALEKRKKSIAQEKRSV
jgi:NTP pyrophosphatase (non-canonical NTP hydrolase)